MDGTVTIGTMIDTKEFDSQMKYIESKMLDIEDKLKQADMGFEVGDTQKLESEYERLGNQLLGLKEKQEKYNQSIKQVPSTNLSGIEKQLSGIGNSVQRITNKIVHWGLAVLSVRGAYMLVRNAVSTITEHDEQLKADIEYMKGAIAYTLEPVVRGIVNLMKTLMFYVGYIVKAWTGKNIFANANKSLEKSGKSAKKLNKELNKTIASFDEMNVVQDNRSKNKDEDTVAPSFDLSKGLPEGKVPGWLEWIAKNKDIVIAGLAGIAGGLLALKLGASGLMSLGIGIAVAGLVFTIEQIIKFIQDPTFDNFLGILKGIAITVLGIAIAFGAWPVAIGAAVALIVLLIVKYFDKIMKLFDDLLAWMDENVLGALRKLFGPLGDVLYAPIRAFVEAAKAAFNAFYGGIKSIIEGVMMIFKGDFWGGIKKIFGGLLNVMTAPLQAFLTFMKSILSKIFGVFKEIGSKAGSIIAGAFKGVVNGVLKAIESILNTPIRAINGLISLVNKLPGVNIGKLKTFSLPRLAKGGIINNPGAGVMVGSAIGGERGMEGVIPLTDSQQMALLGEAIGRYITVDITNVTNLDGRQIARKVDKIQQNNDFVLNR